jgi:FMN reductase
MTLHQNLTRRAPKIVAFSGNTHRPSKSRTLAGAILQEVEALVPQGDIVQLDILDLGAGLVGAYDRRGLSTQATAAIEQIETADALIVASPVYKGSYTGLFKHVFDLVEPVALAGKPVIVAATGGGHRHALVVEHQLRPLFGFFSAATVGTSIYAADAEFENGSVAEPGVRSRISQAAREMAEALQTAELRTLSAVSGV